MKIKIELTFSKIMALVILILGFTSGLILKDVSVIILATTICGSLLANKQYQDRKKEPKV